MLNEFYLNTVLTLLDETLEKSKGLFLFFIESLREMCIDETQFYGFDFLNEDF